MMPVTGRQRVNRRRSSLSLDTRLFWCSLLYPQKSMSCWEA